MLALAFFLAVVGLVVAENAPINPIYKKSAADQFIVIGVLVIVLFVLGSMVKRHYLAIAEVQRNEEKKAKQSAIVARAAAPKNISAENPLRKSLSVGK